MPSGKTPQQEEALTYFRRFAADWRSHAEAPGRQFSLRVERMRLALEAAPPSGRACDLGCGSGELAHALAARGLGVVGIDFAPEMIEIARRTPSSAEFHCASILDFPFTEESFDFFVGNGLIEYFSPEETTALFKRTALALRPGGRFVVHVRNRLFNLFSCNAYTRLEREAGNLERLAEEAEILSAHSDLGEAIAALAPLGKPMVRFDRHPSTTSDGTTIEVSTRHQYSPAEFLRMLRLAGLECEALVPLHFHAFPAPVRDRHPEWHDTAAALVQREAPFSAIPQCSSFVGIGRKGTSK